MLLRATLDLLRTDRTLEHDERLDWRGRPVIEGENKGAQVSAQAMVTIVGNATRDAELRYTKSGLSVGSFGVAVSERQRNEQGEWEDGEASFYDVTCFRLLGESVAETISKGDRVIVTGRLKQSRWEQDGQSRSKIEVLADDVAKSVLWAAKDSKPVDRPRTPAVSTGDEPF